MPLQWINVSTSLPPYHVYTHSLLLTQASKAMMGKAISPLAASKHRKCVKATSRLVPSPCVCVSVWARERERKYVYAGYNIMLISVCVYMRVCLGGSKPVRILCFERQDVKSAVALMPHYGICTCLCLFVCAWVFPRLWTCTTCLGKGSSWRVVSDALECLSSELSQTSFSFH